MGMESPDNRLDGLMTPTGRDSVGRSSFLAAAPGRGAHAEAAEFPSDRIVGCRSLLDGSNFLLPIWRT
jgi:hypothetical protein